MRAFALTFALLFVVLATGCLASEEEFVDTRKAHHGPDGFVNPYNDSPHGLREVWRWENGVIRSAPALYACAPLE